MMGGLLFPACAQAQTLEGQVAALVSHLVSTVEAASSDPAAAWPNATNESWQVREVNWTVAWSCDTAAAASPDARAALEQAGLCPPVEDAAAGQAETESNATVAEVQEIGNSTEAAVEDEIAAVEELARALLDDPTNATGALAVFVDRTVAFLHRLLGIPGAALDAAQGAWDGALDTLVGVGDSVGGAVAATVRTAAETLGGLGATVFDAARDAATALVGAARTVVGTLGSLVRDALEGSIGGAKASGPIVADALEATGRALADAGRALADAVAGLVPDADLRSPAGGPGEAPRLLDGRGGLLSELGSVLGLGPA